MISYSLYVSNNVEVQSLGRNLSEGLNIRNGTVYFSKTRKLCYTHIIDFLEASNISMVEEDVPKTTNGDHADCKCFKLMEYPLV